MGSERPQTRLDDGCPLEDELSRHLADEEAPRPSLQFRRQAWREFQRAIDPLAPPRPFRAFRLR